MNNIENIYLTRMQREFVRTHGREEYRSFVTLLLSAEETERIRKKFTLSFGEITLWRQIVSLQQSYESFC